MAIKKISYDLGGKIKEIASSSVSYDDATGRITANKLSFSTASIGTGEGLLSTTAGGALSASKGGADGDIVSWSTASNSWVLRGETVDLTSIAATNDLGGTYNNATVKKLSNVTIGTLNVANGGTGLTSAQVSALGTGSALLVGHGTSAMTLIKDVDVGDLSKKPVLSANSDGTGWSYITQSALQTNIDVQVFRTSGNWYKPANAKMIRVLVQGAGGGGGSGANRNSAVIALGGAGGSAGAFVDSGLFYVDDSFLTASVAVGAGGAGALFPVTNSAGFTGSAGGSSSFGSASNGPYFAANGGLGGGSGSLNSAVTSSGGASVTASSNIYDLVNYNNTKVVNSSRTGSNNSTTSGISNSYTYTSGVTYYNAGGGGSGGSLSTNYTTNYAGGNGGITSYNSGSITLINALAAITSSATSSIGNFIYPQDIFVASGGGGGASFASSSGGSGGLGGNGAWGSGGGGGGASTNHTGSLVGTRQGGNGGDGYVAVISYKDF